MVYNCFFTRYGLKIIWFCIVFALDLYGFTLFLLSSYMLSYGFTLNTYMNIRIHTDWLMKTCCVCEIHGLLVATLAP